MIYKRVGALSVVLCCLSGLAVAQGTTSLPGALYPDRQLEMIQACEFSLREGIQN